MNMEADSIRAHAPLLIEGKNEDMEPNEPVSFSTFHEPKR